MRSGLPCVKWLLSDRGYDADWFMSALKDKGIGACIPGRKQRKTSVKYDKRCNRIEIMFGRRKDRRRVATRYDRCPKVFLSAIALTALVIARRRCQGAELRLWSLCRRGGGGLQVCLDRGGLTHRDAPIYENSMAEALKSACLVGLVSPLCPRRWCGASCRTALSRRSARRSLRSASTSNSSTRSSGHGPSWSGSGCWRRASRRRP